MSKTTIYHGLKFATISGIGNLAMQIYLDLFPTKFPLTFLSTFTLALLCIVIANITNKERSYKNSLIIGGCCAALSYTFSQIYWLSVNHRFSIEDIIFGHLMIISIIFASSAVIGLFFRKNKSTNHSDTDILDS